MTAYEQAQIRFLPIGRFYGSTYEVLQILSMSLTDTTHLRDLFDKTIFKNDKDRSGSSEPNLFNY